MSDRSHLPLALHLFGPFEASVRGTPLPRLRSRKGQWLLALLALRDGAPVERSWLAGTLWPDSDTPQSGVSLRGTLADLRRALGPEADRLQSPTSRTLALDLKRAFVDVAAFDGGVRRGDEAGLEEAVARYRGPLLEGCDEEWVFSEREVREQAYLAALEQLATRAEERQEWARAAGWLKRVVAVEGTRESAQRSLMRVLAAGGSAAAALEIYRDLRDLLRRELNAEPDPETTALFQRIRAEARERASRPALAESRPLQSNSFPAAPPLPIEDSASFPRRTDDAPAPHVPDEWPSLLPRPLTRFIGREDQIAAVKGLLSERRLVTLTGPGGCGKTRLALRIAADMGEMADGVRLVELAPLADAELVPQAVAAALEVREVPGQPLDETLVAALKSRHLLLLMDNCEHLIDACARLAERLLRGCPHLRILTTSREALAIPGEGTFTVPPLTMPALEEPLAPEELTRFESVSLFVDRAASASPSFAITAANALSVAQVCRQLDGIPLAIELAAARVRILPVEQLAPRLERDFRLLSGGSRTALPRQQTLRATIDWSYDLISEPERRLLRRLSVFRGGCSLEAAEAVCADDAAEVGEVLDLLGQLVEKSLVVYEDRIDGARYRLLQTIRQYGQERLRDGDEGAAVKRRHRDYSLRLAEAAEPEFRGPRLGEWLGYLEREHDNLRAALDQCEESADGVEPGMTLAAALQRFWAFRGHHREARERLTRALARSVGMPGTPARAEALHALGMTLRDAGEFAASRALHQEGLTLCRELGDRPGEARAYGALADRARDEGDLEQSRTLAEASLAICRALDHPHGIAGSLQVLALTLLKQGDRTTGHSLLERSLELYRGTGDPNAIVALLFNLGGLERGTRNDARAISLLQEALEIARRIGLKWAICVTLQELGRLTAQRGELDHALDYCEQSVAMARQITPLQEARARWDLARVLAQRGEDVVARSQFENALRIARETGERWLIAASLGGLGPVFARQGDLPGAIRCLEEALPLARDGGEETVLAETLYELGRLLGASGDHARARALLGESLAIRRQWDDTVGMAICQESLAALTASGRSATHDTNREPSR